MDQYAYEVMDALINRMLEILSWCVYIYQITMLYT